MQHMTWYILSNQEHLPRIGIIANVKNGHLLVQVHWMCLSDQHKTPAPAIDHIKANTPLAFTDAFKQTFCYTDWRSFSG